MATSNHYANGTQEPRTEAAAERALTGEPLTLGYRPSLALGVFYAGGDYAGGYLAQSVLYDVERMLYSPAVAMPYLYYRAGIANVKFKVKAKSTKVGEFVHDLYKHFWENSLDQAQLCYDYGWGGYEVCYRSRRGMLHFDCLQDFHALDTWALTRRNHYVGISVRGVEGATAKINLWGPRHWPAKGLWLTHNRRFNRFYGRSQLTSAWRPWRRLAFRDGMEEVIDGACYRMGYRGPVMRYPIGAFKRSDGSVDYDAAREKSREFVEQAKAGMSIALPNDRDEKGEYKWTVEFPQQVIDVAPLTAQAKELERQISYGIGVPPELMEASETGSGWSGRKVPLIGFFTSQKRNVRGIVAPVKRQIAEPLVLWNFGKGHEFEVEAEIDLPAELKEPDKEQAANPGMPGADAGGQQQPGGGGQQAAGADPGLAQMLAQAQGGGGQQPGATLATEEPTPTPPDVPPMPEFDPLLALEDPERVLRQTLRALARGGEKARRKLLALLKRQPIEAALAVTRSVLAEYQPELVEHLTQAQVAAALQAMRRVAERVPEPDILPGQGTPPPTAPPETPVVPDEPGRTRLPLIEEAAADLRRRQLLTRSDYDRLEAEARQQAFTVAGVEEQATLDVVRNALVDAVEQGQTLREFVGNVEESTGQGTFLSPAHAENVFRTNVQTAYSNGQQALLDRPGVGQQFPYAAYHCIHDDRLRDTHRSLETHGIQGTNIYRRDDPVWQMFQPPWDWQDRCSWVPLSIREAARRGIHEAQKWLETGLPPAQPAWVEMPPFRPDPSFVRPAVTLSIPPDAAGDGADADRERAALLAADVPDALATARRLVEQTASLLR